MRELTYYRGTPVPYITTWDQEVQAAKNGAGTAGTRVEIRQLGLPGAPLMAAYQNEVPHDRDAMGCLWQRYPLAHGKGKPHFAKVHPARQRRAMTRNLCQVCGNPADRNELGWLWLITRDDAERIAQGGERAARVSNPPVCQRCCDLARELCPHLLKGNAAVRVHSTTPWGVYGIRIDQNGSSPGHTAAYTDPTIHSMIAGQMLVRLEGVIITDLSLNP